MQTYEEIKNLLTESEQAAVEVLLRAGWIPFADAMIEQAKAEGYRYSTYNIGGRYQFCLTANDLQKRQAPPAEQKKKRGRPKKL
jgi:hypothetical protein